MMKKLYESLMERVSDGDSFFLKDDTLDGVIYRMFNYRLASYTEFQKPGALEARGIMFEIDEDGKFVNIKTRPMAKFFNLHELLGHPNCDIDTSKVIRISEKADGSLISTYSHRGRVQLKSKGSLSSDQANDSNEYLYHRDNKPLLWLLEYLVSQNFTVNMEWCSPTNRIVLSYDTPHLKILNVRHNISGKYLDIFDGEHFGDTDTMKKYLVESFVHEDPKSYIESVKDMTGIEGFVCELEDGTFFKIKTDAYVSLHHSKDSINSPRRLYEVVLNEATDDLRSLFYDDLVAIAIIEEMEERVGKLYNHLVNEVETFYNDNKHLERKEYALAGRSLLDGKSFGLAMNLYIGRPVNYTEFMIKKWKEFGVKDVEKVDIEE